MTLPLNIDFHQIILHLLNFSVLTLGLYILLYKPVKNFMETREKYYHNLHNKAEEELKHAEELKSNYEKRLDSLETEVEEYRAHALQEAKMAADEIIQNTKEKASKIIMDAHKAAQLEREKIIEGAQKEIANLVISATEKVLVKSSSESLDQFLYSVKKE